LSFLSYQKENQQQKRDREQQTGTDRLPGNPENLKAQMTWILHGYRQPLKYKHILTNLFHEIVVAPKLPLMIIPIESGYFPRHD